MQRSYLIVLAVCGGIFLFAVGFYVLGDSGPDGRTDAPQVGDAGTTAPQDADDAETPTDRDDASPPPRSSLADATRNAESPSRDAALPTRSGELRPRRSASTSDEGAPPDGGARSALDRLKSTVDMANREAGSADADREDGAGETLATDGERIADATPSANDATDEADADGTTPDASPADRSATGSNATAEESAEESGDASADAASPPTLTIARNPDLRTRGETTSTTGETATPDQDARSTPSTRSQPVRRSETNTSERNAGERSDRPTQRPSDRTYVIEPGDTLEGIAIKLYGDAVYWDEIAQANPLVDPRKLRVGQEIRLPSEAAIEGKDKDETQIEAPGEVVRYTVRPGDTLSTIARAYYGQASRWRYLYNVNRDTIGANPNALQAGDVLEIPPFPEVAE
ncbi:MAG: LysM peptidoglycan-binding domain-containing protein [Phycisphaeraceae bacterium]